MTEHDWFAATDPEAMIRFFDPKLGKRTRRKVGLYTVAACRNIELLLDAPCRDLLVMIEQFFDGDVDKSTIQSAWTALQLAYQTLSQPEANTPENRLTTYQAVLFAGMGIASTQGKGKRERPWASKMAWMLARKAAGHAMELEKGELNSIRLVEEEGISKFSWGHAAVDQ